MRSIDPIAPCSICGGKEFTFGPCNRLSNTNRLPKCCKCGSLERHRIINNIFSLIPQDILQNRRGLQFSDDKSVDHTRFSSFVVSEYEAQNSLDIQAIDLPDSSFDWIISNHVLNFVPNDLAALGEMARVVGQSGIVMLTVGGPTHRFGTTRYNRPTGFHQAFYIYGTDFADRIMEAVPECSVLEVIATDTSTANQDAVYFYSQDWAALRRIAAVAAPANIYARLTPALKCRRPGEIAPAWAELERELEIWHKTGTTPRLWIRDDDANAVHCKLTALWETCQSNGIPLCIATIPAQCDENLSDWAADKPSLTVVQHGFSHTNRSHQGNNSNPKSSEFPLDFPVKQALRQIRTGQLLLTKLFQTKFAPIFVPPWGECSDSIVSMLFSLGFKGYSVSGRRTQPQRHDLGFANAHVFLPVCAGDSWGVDEQVTILRLAEALREIRLCAVDPGEPLGINTHHKGMTEKDFNLLKQIIEFTVRRGAEWIDVRKAMGLVDSAV